MHVVVLRFPGTNCEFDTKYAFERLGAEVSIIWHEETTLPSDTSLVVLPGGFSYGDYLRSGALAKHAPIMAAVKEYASKGGFVLGICNGFQILTETGLLPGALKRNDNLHFISKHHHIKVVSNNNPFLQNTEIGEALNIPVAHHDGNFYANDELLQELIANDQVLLQYCDKDGNNQILNGSVEQIAGICNKEKNVFGLMPHPERAMEALLGSVDGVKMLEGFLK